MITLSVLFLVIIILVAVVMGLLSLPLLVIMGILPWLCGAAGVVLLVKALLEKPCRWENFIPAVIAFALYVFLR